MRYACFRLSHDLPVMTLSRLDYTFFPLRSPPPSLCLCSSLSISSRAICPAKTSLSAPRLRSSPSTGSVSSPSPSDTPSCKMTRCPRWRIPYRPSRRATSGGSNLWQVAEADMEPGGRMDFSEQDQIRQRLQGGTLDRP